MGKNLRDQVLREQGRGVDKEPWKLAITPKPPPDKTPAMQLLELRFDGVDIVDLLRDGSVREAAERLGIHFSMVSKWRKRLGITK